MPVFNNILAGAAGQAGGAAAAAGPIKSVRFNDADSAYLNRTPSSAGNRTTWTWTGWVKRGNSTNYPPLYSVNGEDFVLRFTNTDTLEIYSYGTGYNFRLLTTAVYRDSSAWYHILLAYDSTQATDSERISLYVNGSEVTSFSSTTWPSLNHQSGNSATAWHIGNLYNTYYFDGYLADVYFIDGQALDPTDFGAFDDNGVWQAAAYSGTFGTNGFHLFDFANESGIGNDSSGNDNDFTANNLVGSIPDISTDDVTVYRDGAVYASGNPGNMFDSNKNTYTYAGSNNTTNYIDWSPTDGYETSGHIWIQGGNGSGGGCDSMTVTINGSTVTRSAVVDNETYINAGYGWGDWHKYTVSGNTLNSLRVTGAYALIRQLSTVTDPTHATLGISDDNDVPVIEIVDPANLDVLRDVPTNGDSSDDTGAGGELSGNYATFNPLNTPWTLEDGNLEATAPSSPARSYCPASIYVNSGKWYAEIELTNNGGTHQPQIGVVRAGDEQEYIGYSGTGGVGYEPNVDRKYASGTATTSFYGQTYTSANYIFGLALDMDAGTLDLYVDGVSLGQLASGLSGYYAFAAGDIKGAGLPNVIGNFGQRAFAYSAPSGYKTLCTTNLPTPTIADGSDYFDTLLYTGNAGSQTISGYEFAPSFLWLKSRGIANNHWLSDAVRGAGNVLLSNATSSEQNYTAYLTSFTSDGFTLANNSDVNSSSDPLVAWAWDAGTSTVSNTDGSITTSVRANQTAGFSIVSFTGTNANGTVGHGLNAKPYLYIIKNRDTASNWFAFTDLIDGSNDYLYLNTTGSKNDAGLNYANVATSSVFYMGIESGGLNTSGDEHIAYCFAPVAGYSAFGSYEGNGSTDGPFIYTGFRPKWVMYKSADTAKNWQIQDTERDSDNPVLQRLSADLSDAEYTGTSTSDTFDALSNGFKIRGSNNGINQSSTTYIYAAFAENPFQANGGLAR